MTRKVFITIAMVLFVASAASAQLAGYWKFDETSGLTAADSSGKGKTGDLYAEDLTNYPDWTTGHTGSGGAILLNADTTEFANSNCVIVDITTTDALAQLGEAFTIATWVRRDALVYDIWPRIVDTDVYDVELAMDPDGSLDGWDPYDFFWADTTSAWRLYMGVEAAAQKTLGNWYHLAISYDGNYIRKYVNGVAVYTSGAPQTFSLTANTDLFIGDRTDGDAYFVGALDDLAIWSGGYLSGTEIAKLANNTATPLAVTESAPLAELSPALQVETNLAFDANGYKTLWDTGFNWAVSTTPTTVSAWWIPRMLAFPGDRCGTSDIDKFYVMNLADYSRVARNQNKYGVEWIDPSWSGRASNMAAIAAYITPGIALCQQSWGYQLYRPELYNWENKDYFKTYARVAAVNAGDAKLRIKLYTYPTGGSNPWQDPAILTPLGEVYWPLGYYGDYVWQEMKYALPKPTDGDANTRVWFEVSISGGNANTMLYIDQFAPVSDQGNVADTPHAAAYLPGDIDKDAIVYYEDLWAMGNEWLDGLDGILDPRSGGLLTNGDFSADIGLLPAGDDARVYMNPAGWTFTGTVAGNYGLQRVDKKGEMNYSWLHTLTPPVVATPLGGYVAAYTTDASAGDTGGVLEQTASANAVSGQTYYAMGYVMTNTWYGWKDPATMSIAVDGVNKASFVRRLSRNKWRAVYGTYTAVPADAGKPIKISFEYEDIDPNGTYAGNLLVGYAYLGTTVPNEWPEKRQNVLVNGGFEDLSVIQSQASELYTSLTTSDNSGSMFLVSSIPSTPGWVYEVPSGYDFYNKGGLYARGRQAPPLPTPGLNDVAFFVDNDLILGQVVGSLASGTTYYLDAACGVSTYDYSTWPSPAPQLRVELWRIPAGVTSGTVIHDAIAAGNPSYIKVAEANVPSTGSVDTAYSNPASKWHIIGTSYVAVSLDTNMYVRIRGTGGYSSTPEYAFSDVYLSTQKRAVPGGAITYNLSSGLQYDVLGPYNCYHAGLMGLEAPVADIDGNCMVNLVDYAYLAENWVKDWFNNITGSAPWN